MHREAVVEIDGEQVVLECTKLTVGGYNQAAALRAKRGSSSHSESRELTLARIEMLDRYIRAKSGQVVVDDLAYTLGLARLFAGRDEVVFLLYHALLQAQQPSAADRHSLEVATRFNCWLEKKREKTSRWVETGTSCQKCHELRLCQQRGCDGERKKGIVWHDKKLILHVCPVLSFTPEVEETLRLFYWTHEQVVHSLAVYWSQQQLVSPGGIDGQDAWLTGAFGYLRKVHNELDSEEMKRPR